MIGNYTETIEYIGSDNMSRDGKYIRVEPKECLELETSENMVDALEKLTDTIQRLRFKEATSICNKVFAAWSPPITAIFADGHA